LIGEKRLKTGLLLAGLMLSSSLTFAAKGPDLAEPPAGTQVQVDANRITYDGKSKIAVATGTVVIVYGSYVLTATRVVYDQVNDRFSANGSVVLKEANGYVLEAPRLAYDAKTDTATARSGLVLTNVKGDRLEADEAELRNKFKEGFARHIRLLLASDATVTADYATRVDGNITVFDRATYTACKTCVTRSGGPIWQIISQEVTHNEDERTLYHKNARLEIAGVPVLWTPYLSHPDPSVKRRSGFLVPKVGQTEAYGFGVELPYFINLAPNYDVTLKPVFTTKQGVLAQAQWRHRLNTGTYRVEGEGIYQLDKNEPAPGDTRWRGALRTKGDFAPAPGWAYGWDGALVSDRTFMNRYDIDNADQAESRVYLTNIKGRNYFSAEALHYQTLLTTENQDQLPVALPYIQYSYIADTPAMGGEFGIDASAYSMFRDEATTPFTEVDHGTEQIRTSATAHWQKRMVTDFGAVVTPFAEGRGDLYVTRNLADALTPEEDRGSDTVARFLPRAGLDARYPLVAESALGQSIVTPVAQIISSVDEPDEDRIGNEDAISVNFDQSSLFLSDRFTGLDRYEGGTRANAGLLYTLLMPNGGFLRLSGGESFHLAGENSFETGSGLEGNESDLVGAIAFQPNDHVSLAYQARLEEDLSDVNAQEGSLSLTFDRISGSLSYVDVDSAPRYGRPNRDEQTWGWASWNFTGAWSINSAFRYDFEEGRFMSKSLGLAFNCDCMGFSLTYSQSDGSDGDVEPTRSILATIRFKSLGSASGGTGL
jgi:LPS-assembly protein